MWAECAEFMLLWAAPARYPGSQATQQRPWLGLWNLAFFLLLLPSRVLSMMVMELLPAPHSTDLILGETPCVFTDPSLLFTVQHYCFLLGLSHMP